MLDCQERVWDEPPRLFLFLWDLHVLQLRIMKKLLLLIGTILVLGAGCGQHTAEVVPQNGTDELVGSSSSSPLEQPPRATDVTIGGQDEHVESASASTSQQPPEVQKNPVADLKELPAVDPTLAASIDDSAWIHAATRNGTATVTSPTKGSYSPTWTYTLLANDDPHLKGNCYLTDATIYKRTNFSGVENVCQTTTSLTPGPGTRTDYYIFHDVFEGSSGKQVTRTHLLTFSKIYPAGFNMEEYSATIERIINILD